MTEKQPMAQFSTPEQIGALAVFLCSDAREDDHRRAALHRRRLGGAVARQASARAGQPAQQERGVTVLVTGVAGFIGYHVADALLARGERVLGLDNLNAYYDVRLKQARLDRLETRPGFSFQRIDVADREAVQDFVTRNPEIDRIVHLAAQAGVRHSLVDPYAYVQSNVMGHLVIQEAARRLGRTRAPGLRQLVLGLRRQPGAPVRRDRPGRYAGLGLRRHQAGGRADEPRLRAPVRPAADRPALLHGLRAVGPAGHGLLRLRRARSWPASRSRSTTTAACGAISPISTTSWPACWAASTGRPTGERRPAVLNIGNHRSERVSTLIALLEQALGRAAVIRDVPAAAGRTSRRPSPRSTRSRR